MPDASRCPLRPLVGLRLTGVPVWVLLAVLSLLMPLAAEAAPPPTGDAAACQVAVQAAERSAPVPPALLSAIARTESGRVLPGGGRVAWPWTINVSGTGHYYDSAPEAVAAVEAFRAAGMQSIDVGCMQVNLMHHPTAFASLQQAFDPAANAAYAAQFLIRLRAEIGTWPGAIGAYHSRTPGLAEPYGRLVMQAWPLAPSYGATGIAARQVPRGRTTIDPYQVYTPEFARKVALATAARIRRDGTSLEPEPWHSTGLLARRFPSQLQALLRHGGRIRLAQAELPS